jgi:Tfp pilus assembly protein PilO
MNLKQKINFRNQLLLIILKTAGLVMLGVLGMFYFSRDIEHSVIESIQRRGQIFTQSRQIENYTRLKSDYEKYQSYFPKLKSALPSREELIVLPSRFETEARAAAVSQTFIFGEEVAAVGTEPQGILFSLNLTATGFRFLDYLDRINNLPYFLTFTQFDMISSQGHRNTSQFSIKGKVYTR